jgi:hypothetical protein
MKKIFLNIVILILFCCLPGCSCDNISGPVSYKYWKECMNPNGTWEQYKEGVKKEFGSFPDSNQPHLRKFNLNENHEEVFINLFNPFDRKPIATIILDKNHEVKILVR